ncbi:hypothetical protein OIO90_002359 [Microbotryomycetes sp. JL221]|nr:hypothetical protein OIO90_002359 [Microbotryomycetes sp. JL221]
MLSIASTVVTALPTSNRGAAAMYGALLERNVAVRSAQQQAGRRLDNVVARSLRNRKRAPWPPTDAVSLEPQPLPTAAPAQQSTVAKRAPIPIVVLPVTDAKKFNLTERTLTADTDAEVTIVANPKMDKRQSADCEKSCQVTTDCDGESIPANAHQWCDVDNGNVCSWRCNKNFIKRSNGCSRVSIAAPQTIDCRVTADCSGLQLIDNSKAYCNPNTKQCQLNCLSGYTMNPWTKECQRNTGIGAECRVTSDCSGVTLVPNSKAYCNPSTKKCQLNCASGYTMNPWTKLCQKNAGTTTVTTTTTSSAPDATNRPCSLTLDCAGVQTPANAHNWCDVKNNVCSWRCNQNFVKSGGNCIRSQTTTTAAQTTTAKPTTTTTRATITTTQTPKPTSGTRTCSLTSDCNGLSVPSNGHNYCDQTTRTCSFRCNTGFVQSGSSCVAQSNSMISGGYYADWTYEDLPVDKIDYDRYDLINFSFAVPTSTYDVEFIGWNSDQLLRQLVSNAHARNTKVLIAIGGWSSSQYFSDAVLSQNRATFVRNIVTMVNKYGVDGVDIDWEYPNSNSNPGNTYRSSDTANFLLFLQALRQALGSKMHISSCATQRAFIGADGSPLADVKGFAKVLDAVLVMNYDVWGASAYPGPNAPLKNACPNSMQPGANMQSSIDAWENAGMPASKILMGVPSYGYVSASSATSLVHKKRSLSEAQVSESNEGAYVSPFRLAFEKGHAELRQRLQARRKLLRQGIDFSKRQVFNATANSGVIKTTNPRTGEEVIYCPGNHSGQPCPGVKGQNITENTNWNPLIDIKNGNGTNSTDPGVFNPGNWGKTKLGNGDLSGLEGNQVNYWKLLGYAVMVESGDKTVGVNGYTRVWDTCSSTPFLYDVSRRAVVTYDDAQSLRLKGQLAKQRGIGGIMMWEMSGDTLSLTLTKAWRSGMGLSA